jgi:hypothetical protein
MIHSLDFTEEYEKAVHLGQRPALYKQFASADYSGGTDFFKKAAVELSVIMTDVWVVETPTKVFVYKSEESFKAAIEAFKGVSPKKTGGKQLQDKLVKSLIELKEGIPKAQGMYHGVREYMEMTEKLEKFLDKGSNLKEDIESICGRVEEISYVNRFFRKPMRALAEAIRSQNYTPELMENARKLMLVSEVNKA